MLHQTADDRAAGADSTGLNCHHYLSCAMKQNKTRCFYTNLILFIYCNETNYTEGTGEKYVCLYRARSPSILQQVTVVLNLKSWSICRSDSIWQVQPGPVLMPHMTATFSNSGRLILVVLSDPSDSIPAFLPSLVCAPSNTLLSQTPLIDGVSPPRVNLHC